MRVPLSWLNAHLSEAVSARQADEILGEAGVTVARVDGVGAACRSVVVGEVVDADAGAATVLVPTRELVRLSNTVDGRVRLGARVAVALTGSLLFADADADADAGWVVPGPRGTVRVATSGAGPTSRIGQVCRARDLGGAGDTAVLLPSDTAVGSSVRPLLPAAAGDEVLTLRIPSHLAHLCTIAGLATEICARTGTTVVGTPQSVVAPATTGSYLNVDVPGAAAAAVVINPRAGPADPVARRRLLLAGVVADDVLDVAIQTVAYERGVRFSVHPAVSGPFRVTVRRAGPHGDHRLDGLRPVAPGVPDALLLVATATADVTEVHCRSALMNVCDAVGVQPLHAAAAHRLDIGCHDVTLDLDETTARTGLALGVDEIAELLARIGARTETSGQRTVRVAVPRSRADLVDPVALAGELVRLAGVRRIVASLPTPQRVSSPGPVHQMEEQVRAALLTAGFQELVTSLVARSDQCAEIDEHALALDGGDGRRAHVRLSLVEGLAGIVADRPDTGAVNLFEVGTVAARDRGEQRMVAVVSRCVASDGASAHQRHLRAVTRALRTVLDRVGAGRDIALAFKAHRGFLPGAAVTVLLRGEPVGRLGLVEGTSGTGRRIVAAAAEVALAGLVSVAPSCAPRRAAPNASKVQPAATRDVTLAVASPEPSVDSLLAVLRDIDPLVTRIDVVDVHASEQDVGAIRCITFRITMSSPWRAVPRAEANEVVNRAVAACEQRGAVLRR